MILPEDHEGLRKEKVIFDNVCRCLRLPCDSAHLPNIGSQEIPRRSSACWSSACRRLSIIITLFFAHLAQAVFDSCHSGTLLGNYLFFSIVSLF